MFFYFLTSNKTRKAQINKKPLTRRTPEVDQIEYITEITGKFY